MKIKMTLIAFFATALMFTSCVKNEVSPGIEDVRSAYADLLSAKAQAEIILANATANFDNARAAYEEAMAALRLAEAEGELAAAEQLRADLAQDLILWANDNATEALALQKVLDAYEAWLIANENTIAEGYFGKYVGALNELQTAKDNIFNKQAQILALGLDVANGTTLAYDALVVDLADATAELADLQAEYDVAAGFLGDVDAVLAKIADLAAQKTTLEKLVQGYEIDKVELNLDAAVATHATAVTTEATKKAAWTTAKALVTTARVDFEAALANALTGTVLGIPVPQFWDDAVQNVIGAQAAVNTYDTLTAYNAWNNVVANIALGTTAQDLAITNQETVIADLVLDSLKLISDTGAARTAWTNAIVALSVVQNDTATLKARNAVLEDSILTYPARAAIYQAEIDLNDAEITYADIVRLPNANALVTSTLATKVATLATYTSDIVTVRANIVAEKVTLVTLVGNRTTRLAAIVLLELQLPDLYSNYLFTLTYFDELQADLVAAIAAKEAARPDFNTFMDEFFADYVVGLEANVVTALAAYDAAIAATATAKLALAPLEAIDELIADAGDDIAFIVKLETIYGTTGAYNTAYLTAFATAIATIEGTIVTIESNMVIAQTTYVTSKVNYDKYMEDMEVLNAKLANAQSLVDYWKALLDAALAG
jgi:hypothetical protein